MSYENKEHIFLERRGPVATIVVNRPLVRNAINYAMWRVIRRFAADVESDQSIRALILRGAGGEAFSAGADIGEFERCRNDSKQARVYSEAFDGALDAIWNLGKPVIAMIDGVCVGGGLELACCADIRIAAEGGRFGIPTARLGVLVGYREMRRLVQLIGIGAASDILISARIFNAEEALRIGLISRIVTHSDLEKTVYDLAADVAGMAPLIHREHKRIMRTVLENPSLSKLSPEQDALPFSSFDTEDFQEGRRAFLEKRRPVFKGR
ncbi:MAG: enoyl-CoA hydratase-related protein [Blastocatellia bacterium]